MRDRLFELLKNSRHLDVMYGDDRTFGKAADELLSNGVIVPPLKIGDKVYTIGWFNDIEESKVVVVRYECFEDECRWRFVSRIGVASDIAFTDGEIGKTVFFTKEDAEKALADGGAE